MLNVIIHCKVGKKSNHFTDKIDLLLFEEILIFLQLYLQNPIILLYFFQSFTLQQLYMCSEPYQN